MKINKERVVAKVIEALLTERIKTEVNNFVIRLKKVEASELKNVINEFFELMGFTLTQKNEVTTSLIKSYQLHLVSPEHKQALKDFIKENKLKPDVTF